MAKFNSLVFNEISGKMGAMVLSRNGTARARTTPRNPDTDPQLAVRNGLAAASAAWSALGGSRRAGWGELARGITRTNSVGREYRMTGRRLFLACCQNARPVFPNAPLDAPVSVPPIGPPTGFGVAVTPPSPSHPHGLIALSGASPGPTYGLVLRTTGPASFDRNVFGPSRWRVLACVPPGGSAPTPDALALLFASRYGPVPSDTRLLFSAFLVDADGFRGPAATVDVISAASGQGELGAGAYDATLSRVSSVLRRDRKR